MDALTIAAASGLRSRMESLDLLANNLANSATAGYKRDQEFYGLFSSDEAAGAGDGPTSTLPVIQRQWTDFSPGVLQVTGNPMNVALSGDGFFAVNGSNGPLYTRNGNLQVLPSGSLATADGYALRNTNGETLQVASNKPIEILSDGTVRQDGQSLGQIAVVNFKSTTSLTKVGSTCFQNGDPKNPPVPAANVEVQQGKLEGSNVPVAEAAMRLVGVMRQFEMLQKAIGVSSEMDTKTIQEVARVGS
ncbi:MAG: flagellar hook basal-body protein [Candidatus Solibacter sp.]|jgi:flagellar basal body rod protein FlgG